MNKLARVGRIFFKAVLFLKVLPTGEDLAEATYPVFWQNLSC
jgi:hypothetical protein